MLPLSAAFLRIRLHHTDAANVCLCLISANCKRSTKLINMDKQMSECKSEKATLKSDPCPAVQWKINVDDHLNIALCVCDCGSVQLTLQQQRRNNHLHLLETNRGG